MALPIEEQNIIKILGIENLPNEEKLEILELVTDVVQQRLLLRLSESLPAEKQAEFRSVIDKQDQATLESFIKTNAPNLMDWVVEEVGKVKKELAGRITS